MSRLVLFLLAVHLVDARVLPDPNSAAKALTISHRFPIPKPGNSSEQHPQKIPEDNKLLQYDLPRTKDSVQKRSSGEHDGNDKKEEVHTSVVYLGSGEETSSTPASYIEYKFDDHTTTEESKEHQDRNIKHHRPHHGDGSRSHKAVSFELEPPEDTKVTNVSTAFIIGLRIEGSKGVNYEQNGVSTILADTTVPVRLFGQHFTNQTVVRFVKDVKSRGADCNDPSMDVTEAYPVSHLGPNGASAVVDVSLSIEQSEEFYFICVKENNTEMPWVHQGSDPWITIKVYERLLPLWLNIVFICLLLCLSGLFAGLTLGLLALDRTDLKILANTGSEKERMYAKTILPLRTQGNYLLCSLVLGNVLINSSLTILLDELTSGILAVTFSTLGIVIFGEIIPQAFCSRHGLAIGAKTILITRLIMILTFPMSYVISMILDKVLGEEIGIVYNREKLKELVKITIEHNDLEADEVNIISGALELRKKTVEHVMTRLEDIYMLPLDGLLDFETLNEIRKQGYSRIPIFDGDIRNIVTILYIKDLVFVDSNEKVPLKTYVELYNKSCFFVFADTTLDVVFKEFKESQRGHMAFVQKIHVSSNDRDPYCETIGLVTLEDVIEELIQAEIVDETDVWIDNRSKKRTKQTHTKDFLKFVEIRNSQKTIYISPQLALAAFQFLSTGVEPFKTNYISEGVLHKILKKNVLFKIRGTKDLKPCFLYEIGKATDSFTLILEGRVEVTVGKEGLQYEAGPFSYFAVPALMLSGDCNFVADYSVKATGDVVILRIRRPLYQAAAQATILERARKKDSTSGVVDPGIDKQIEDVLGKLEVDNGIDNPEKIVEELESSDDSESGKEHSLSTNSTDADN